MIDVSELYKENIYKEDSELCCKVEVYFDEIPDVFDDKIFSISMIEELNIESGVVAKECIISFINNDDVFTPTDKEGPFYGLIKPNVKIRPFIGVVVNDEPEYVPLGTYFVEEWVPSGILMNVKCYDILYNLQDKESPKTRIKKDVTLYEYTSNFMELLGCEYVITDRLKKVQLQYPYYGKTIGETLKNISIAGNCFIFIDRYDRVIVKNKTYEEQKEVEWNMTEEHIYSVDNPQDYKKIYSGIEIESKMPNISKSQKVLEIDDFEVEKGKRRYRFGFDKPVVKIQYVLVNSTNVILEKVEYGTWEIVLTLLNNKNDEEIIKIEVVADIVEEISNHYRFSDTELIQSVGEKTLNISSNLLCDKDHIVRYGTDTLFLYKDPTREFKIVAKGNPALEVGDIISLTYPVEKIEDEKVQMMSQEIFFDGNLKSSIVAQKPMSPVDWTYVSPGLYVQSQREVI